MPYGSISRYHIPQSFAPDTRPGADEFVYCKGCGQPLDDQPRLAGHRAVVSVMMCTACCQTHGHQLMPKPGAPSYCYRCGSLDEVFVESGMAPATYHVCPRCVPERAARYRGGHFGPPPDPAIPVGPTDQAATS